MKSNAANLVTIVIPALHRPDLTASCVASVLGQSLAPSEMEIIVAENDARPGSVFEPSPQSRVRQLWLPANYGTTGSVNRTLAVSASQFVLLLNNDVELESQFLQKLLSALANHPECAFATGKMLNASARNRLDGAGDALLMGGGAYRLGHDESFNASPEFGSSRLVMSGCGAATLYRRSVLEQLGGLDEDLFAYLDDIDLGLRIHLLGYYGIYVPEAVAYHVGSATLGDPVHPKIIRWITRNQLLILAKDYPFRVLLRVFPRILTYQVLWAFLALRRNALMSCVRGLIDAIKSLPGAVRRRRAIQRHRVISTRQFLQLLQQSEAQIHSWYQAQDAAKRSSLLTAYFKLFPVSERSTHR